MYVCRVRFFSLSSGPVKGKHRCTGPPPRADARVGTFFFYDVRVCVLTGDFYLFFLFLYSISYDVYSHATVSYYVTVLQRRRLDVLRGPGQNNFIFRHHFFFCAQFC